MSKIRVTERDRRLLAFAAEHRFVMAAHLAALLGVSTNAAHTRLRDLSAAGYLTGEHPLTGESTLYRVTTPGLRAIGSDLPRPRKVDLSTFRHEAGMAWLTVAAERGMFGALERIVSERRMRSQDPREGEDRETFGVRLGVGRGGLHYPDMLVVTDTGHRLAFELELTYKPPRRRDAILGAYAVDRQIDAVVYLVEDPQRRREIQESVRRVGIGDRVRVEQVTLGHRQPPASRAPTLTRRARRETTGAGR